MSAEAKGGESDGLFGRVLGDFVVLDKLGEGGFGSVYRAEQKLLGRAAVIKVLNARHRSNPALIQRFLREARLASSLDHPYGAHIYAFGAESDGLLWLAMELVRGTPLDNIIVTQGPLPLERFVPLFQRLCEVVHAAHERGIVHRDIKPANVMVIARSGLLLPKLLDFGIAKHLDADEVVPGDLEPPGEIAIGDDASTADQALTRDGALIGSPHYMAPEQWMNRELGPYTDVYALGVLAYECLVGQPPFTGMNAMQIARGHATRPVPLLDRGLPPALDVAIARAMAKRPGDRFGSTLDFAEALRVASGLGAEPTNLPSLAPPVRDAVLAEAPQPLAEAVAALEAVRSVHQARDAYVQLVRVVAQLVGLLALSARSRVGAGSGAGEASHAREADELLRVLRRRGLNEREWVSLASALVRPFARRADAHPIPELVRLFFTEEGTPADDRLGPALDLLEESAIGGSEEIVRDLLRRMAEALSSTLRGLAFLSSYPLVAVRDGVAERWMGVRRPRRASMSTHGPALPSERPLLLDARGAPLLDLWPLFQLAAPTPGAAPELFLLAGPGRNVARLVAMPGSYEHHDDTLWPWFATHVLDVAAELTGSAHEEQPPYLGLTSFGADDAALFFGREREVEGALNQLQTQPVLAIVGPSGSGKSSFVQAGMMSALQPAWRVIVVRPGPSPLTLLRARFDREGIPVDDLRTTLARDPGALGAVLRAFSAGVKSRLLLVVDQAEELFTLCTDLEEQRLYVAGVCAAARSADDPVRVIFTLRDDYLMRAQQHGPLRDHLARGLVLLGTPAKEDLLRILVEPARGRGYEFESPKLPEEMVAAVAAESSVLPLLSFTAHRLWEQRDRHFRQLGRRAYEAMGGVGGALAQHAETMLASMTGEEQRLVREAFRHLVTAEGTRAVLSREELLQLLSGGAAAQVTIEKLIAARLLVVGETATGGVRIEIVHEALLATWPRLVEWRREDAEGARLRGQLRAAARQWDELGRPGGVLWRDEAVAEYRVWRARHPQPLTDAEEAFARASLVEATRGRRARQLAIGGLIALLSIGLLVVIALNRSTETQRLLARASAVEAHDRLAFVQEERGRQYLLQADPGRAIIYFSEALQMGRDGPGLRYMVHRAKSPFETQLGVSRGHDGGVYSMTLSKDGRYVVTGGRDGSARVWDARTGALLHTLAGHTGAVWQVELNRAGTRLITRDDSTVARVWDVERGQLVSTLRGHTGTVSWVDWFGDGERVLTGSADRTVRIWDAASARTLLTIGGHDEEAYALASADGRLVVSFAKGDRAARVWDAKTGRLRRRLVGHQAQLFWMMRSEQGLFASAGFDGVARVWNAETGRALWAFEHPGVELRRVRFSDDGKLLFTTGVGQTAWIWNLQTGRLQHTLSLQTGSIADGAFSHGGGRLVTIAYGDTCPVLWDVASGKQIGALCGHGSTILQAAFSSDDTQTWTASADGTLRRWDPRPQDPLALLGPQPHAITAVRFDGAESIVTIDSAQEARRWDLRGSALTDTFAPRGGPYAASAVDRHGHLLVAASGTRLSAWELPSGRPRLEHVELGVELRTLSISADGKRMVGGTAAGDIGAWDLAEGNATRAWAIRAAPLDQLAMADDGGRIAGSAGSSAWVWDGKSGVLGSKLLGHDQLINGLQFDMTGDRLVSASDDNTARIWDAQRGTQRALIHATGEVAAAVISRDDALLMSTTGGGQVEIWDTKGARVLSSTHAHGGAPLAATIDLDDARAVTGASDGTIAVWDLGRDRDNQDAIASWIRCHVPLVLAGEQIVARTASDCSATTPAGR